MRLNWNKANDEFTLSVFLLTFHFALMIHTVVWTATYDRKIEAYKYSGYFLLELFTPLLFVLLPLIVMAWLTFRHLKGAVKLGYTLPVLTFLYIPVYAYLGYTNLHSPTSQVIPAFFGIFLTPFVLFFFLNQIILIRSAARS